MSILLRPARWLRRLTGRRRTTGREQAPEAAGELMIDVHGAQTIGSRKEQQDFFWFIPEPANGTAGRETLAAVVADGMGGHRGGRRASRAAVRGFRAGYGTAAAREDRLRTALEEANDAIREDQEEDGHGVGATGTTLIGVTASAEGIAWISVGDSRLLLLRGGRLEQLNADHSLKPVIEQLRESDPATAAGMNPNELRSALTGDWIEMVDEGHGPPPEDEDVLIAATDGIDTLTDAEILAEATEAPEKSARSVSKALLAAVADREKPRQDNTTVVTIRWTSEKIEPANAETRWNDETATAEPEPEEAAEPRTLVLPS